MDNELSNRIKNRRKSLVIKQQDLADKLGVSLMTVLRWEKGVRAPNASMLPKLAEALNTSVEYLMGLSDADTPQERLEKKSTVINNVENKEPENKVGLGYWGGVVDNARRIARLGNLGDIREALSMLKMATASLNLAAGITATA